MEEEIEEVRTTFHATENAHRQRSLGHENEVSEADTLEINKGFDNYAPVGINNTRLREPEIGNSSIMASHGIDVEQLQSEEDMLEAEAQRTRKIAEAAERKLQQTKLRIAEAKRKDAQAKHASTKQRVESKRARCADLEKELLASPASLRADERELADIEKWL